MKIFNGDLVKLKADHKFVSVGKIWKRPVIVVANEADAAIFCIYLNRKQSANEDKEVFQLFHEDSGFVRVGNDGYLTALAKTQQDSAPLALRPMVSSANANLLEYDTEGFLFFNDRKIVITHDGKDWLSVGDDDADAISVTILPVDSLKSSRDMKNAIKRAENSATEKIDYIYDEEDDFQPEILKDYHEKTEETIKSSVSTTENKQITDTNFGILTEAGEISQVLETTTNTLEQHLEYLQGVFTVNLELADECHRLAEQCKRLQTDIPRLLKLADERSMYIKKIEDLKQSIPDDLQCLIDLEDSTMDKLQGSLRVMKNLNAQLTDRLEHAKNEYIILLESTTSLREQLKSLKVQAKNESETNTIMQAELKEWELENEAIANVLPGAQKTSEVLEYIKTKLIETDHLISEALERQKAKIEIPYSA